MKNNISCYADLFAAMGSEPRLKIMQLLFRSYPTGMVVNEINKELKIPNSTLSHHLEKLRIENLVKVEKDKQFLCYTANAETMEDLLSFLYTGNFSSDRLWRWAETNLASIESTKILPEEEKPMSEQLFRPIWEKLFTSLGFPLPSRFTQEAITAVKFAQCESLRLKHRYVGTEQILIGLISEKSGIAWQFLSEAGLNLDQVQTEAERLIGRGKNKSMPIFMPFTRRVKEAMENALQESLKLDKNHIGTEHVLLGILGDSNSLGFKILENLGVDPSNLEKKLRSALI
ncbi:helix-turn-helix transcriptional regulator [Pleurocapsa sp. PCC 7319]|uniref:ArsR/SmtB family transcription factor n=1 Tax=Pleurocapsa sp. PCC 7319 TaxID=118161 RepID=UPI00037E6034|nr:metalloregulator ArsR/SmtB family transcription factor [Pleurocapsa sp. PCC 7319]